MRKSILIGVAVAAILAAGVTVTWVSLPEGQLTVASVPAIAQTADVDQSITDSGQSAIKNAIAAVGPAVVLVDVEGSVDVTNPFSDFYSDPFFRRFFGDRFEDLPEEQETESVGSGFAIEYDGEVYVLTNAHVVENADTITLTAPDGGTWSAEVVGTDEVVDVAVLHPLGDTSNLPMAALGDSTAVEKGDWAIAIGNPLGLSYTVTLGIISAIDRDIAKPSGIGTYYNLIQTDAAINPGNSGGPLVNSAGEIIGINTLIARNASNGVAVEGINFAIAINSVKDILAQLVESGSVARGWIGVAVADTTAANAAEFGVDPEAVGALIAEVFPGDPAALVGIEVGDIITRVNDVVIEDKDEFVRQIGLLGAFVDVEIEVLRDGETLTFDVTLGLRPSEEELIGYEGSAPEAEAESELGLTVGAITPIVAQHLGLNSTDGVVIIEIAAGSRADNAGLAEGDVILEVNHRSIESVSEWLDVVSGADDDTPMTLTVLRNRQLRFVTL